MEDSCVPNTVISVPGAKAWAYDAPLAMAVMEVVCELPTTKVTGMVMACGMVLADCTVTMPPVGAARETRGVYGDLEGGRIRFRRAG